MKNLFRSATLLTLICVAAAEANATAPTSWIDVVGTYGADPTCTVNSGPAINNAIAAAAAPGAVLFFQTGCYLINTEIVDINTASQITYLGLGNVTLQAGAGVSLPAILQLGDSTHTVAGRRVSNLVFQCASSPTATAASAADGIDALNVQYSVFEDVQILNFGGVGLQNSNASVALGQHTFKGGVISTRFATGTGASLTQTGWTFLGTNLTGSSNSTSGASAGIGIHVEGGQFVCIDCTVSSWKFGIAAALTGSVSALEISAGSYANNVAAEIRVGNPGTANGLGLPSAAGLGVSIHGAKIAGLSASYGTTPFCIDLEAANGFSIVGNKFSCPLDTVRVLADDSTPGQVVGADNGVVGPNDDTNSSAFYRLQGRDITYLGPACSSGSSPANCKVASAGAVAIPAGGFSLTVNDPFVAASSRIVVSEDMTLGSQLGVTCNTVGGRTYSVTSKVAGASFAVTASSAPAANPACLTFHIEN